jgi:hypothetical protein
VRGYTTITATTNDGGFTADFSITVETYVAVTGLSISLDSPSIQVNGSTYVIADFTPLSATNQNLTYTSSNESVAVIDDSGDIDAVGAGTTVIRATSVDNPSVYDEATLTVTGDTTAPEIQTLVFASNQQLAIIFTEEMSSTGLGSTASYSLSNGPAGLAANPSSVSILSPQYVVITLNQAMAHNDSFDISVSTSLTDSSGNALEANGNTVTYTNPPPPVDASKIVIVNGKISGSAGAVTDGDVASNGIYVLAQGAPFTVENIVSYNAPNGDGSFGNTISLSTFLEHVHTNGNYDIIVSDVNDALSTRVTATVTNGL